MKLAKQISIFWFRRDLRLEDNRGLFEALSAENPVLPIFIFDKKILDKLQNRKDARVTFIHQEIARLNEELKAAGGGILTFFSTPKEVFAELCETYHVKHVFANRDYEPYARERDKEIFDFLKSKNIGLTAFKDHVIFDKSEVMKDDGKPYTIYTPYSKKWKSRLDELSFATYESKKKLSNLLPLTATKIQSLKEMNFEKSELDFPKRKINDKIISGYEQTRDFPAINGTSRLSLHLRFGTISTRLLARHAQQYNEKYLNELIWRDFYQMIIYHFPHTVEHAFKPAYDRIMWVNNENDFAHWCSGHTGYPMVDAGMRELNETGFMHNRVRMVVASFLSKHLLIDWRWGEKYFAEKLLDYEMASNVGGWQWAAGCGCDAAPYFRIFNPQSQAEKFDKEFKYIQKWVPEYGTPKYAKPIVDHVVARGRCLDVFKKALVG
jgi:deoxyribodipyrimidine photo-lyase